MVYVRGNQGYVMLSDKQTALTTLKVPTYTGTIAAGEDLKLVKPDKQVLTDRIRNKVAPTVVQLGNIHTEGTLTYDDYPDEAIGINLAMLLGSSNTATGNATSGYIHTLNGWSGCTDYPTSGITVQKRVGGCDNTMQVDNIGTFVNSFTYTIPEEGICTYAVPYMGVSSVFGGTSADPTYSTKTPFEGYMSKLEIGATVGALAAVDMRSCNFTINNNLQMVTDHNVSNQYPSGYLPNTRTSQISFEITQDNSLTFYNYFLNDTENAIRITLTHPQLAGSGTGVYSRVFTFSRVTWLGDEPTLDSADVLTGTYTMEALWDETLSYDVLATVTNSQSGTYSV